MTKRQIKKVCLLFGEGSREKIFFRFLERTKEFENKYYKNWELEYDNAHGSACRVVLEKCINAISDKSFNLVLCFIDLDKLYTDFPRVKDCEKEKSILDQLAKKNNIIIIWQDKNHEDELKRATEGKIKNKARMQERLKNHEQIIVCSPFVKQIFNLLK